jgi:DNA-binding transcriptional LysR family regulator
MYELSQLRCFVAVAEELHFGRAAERLNLTQPPLSRQIQILERILGVELFNRTSRAVRLTPSGRAFLVEARRILRLSEEAAVTVRRVALGQVGSISIGFTAASAYSYLPDLVRRARRALPEVDLVLKEMVSSQQIEALGARRIDVSFMRSPLAHHGFDTLRVQKERLVAALPDCHRLSAQPRVSLESLAEEPFIMYSPGEARYFHDLILTLFAKRGLAPRAVQYLAQVHTILGLVRSTMGVSLVPESAAVLSVKGVVLKELQPPSRPSVELFMAWRSKNDNPLVSALIKLARDPAARPPMQAKY